MSSVFEPFSIKQGCLLCVRLGLSSGVSATIGSSGIKALDWKSIRRLGTGASSFSFRRFVGKSDILALFLLLVVMATSVAASGEFSFLRGVGSLDFCPLPISLLLLERGVVVVVEFRLTSERIRRIEDGGGSRGE